MIEFSLESERLRLGKLYSDIGDQELEQLASDADSLKPIAREVLQAELTRRGLKVELQSAVASGERATPGKLITLRRFRDAPQALLAKTILESADVECFLADENMIRMDWFWSNFIGGIKLWVREEDASTAAELLDQEVHGEIDADSVVE